MAVCLRGMTLRFAVAALALLMLVACDERALDPAAGATSALPAGLSPQQAAAVVAKVGNETITLGDFAAVLERMNQFDRLRYQTSKRRAALLEQLVDATMLAQEARRRGLDKKPEVQAQLRQILRDATLAKGREGLPAPAEIPEAEVRRYYDENKERFIEPERRRVSAIVLDDAAKAKTVLKAALKVKTGKAWGDLFMANSVNAPAKANPNAPLDLAGDLGIVGPPGASEGIENKDVPAPVQRAVFKLKEIGQVYDEVIQAKGRSYIVRMSGRSKGHARGMGEAERAIRVAILQEMIRKREEALEAELRKRFPVKIDEKVLESIQLPAGLEESVGAGDKAGAKPAAADGSASAP